MKHALVFLVALAACETPHMPSYVPPRMQEETWWIATCGDIRPYGVGHDVTPPELLERVPARWPETAQGLLGIVIVQTVIDAEGNVCAARTLKTLEGPVGEELGEAAVAAVKQWRFHPAIINGKAAPVFFSLTVRIE